MGHNIIIKNTRNNINIPKNQTYNICDTCIDTSGEKTIVLEEGARLNYLLITENSKIDIIIQTAGQNSQSTINTICMSKKNQKSTIKLISKIQHSHCQTDTKITSFIGEKGNVNIDGGVCIAKNIEKVAGFLHEKNVILHQNCMIKTLPMLDVQSNDVEAAHGASIDTLDDKKLFYIHTRGINKQKAKELIIASYISTILQESPSLSTEQKKQFKVQLLDKILAE